MGRATRADTFRAPDGGRRAGGPRARGPATTTRLAVTMIEVLVLVMIAAAVLLPMLTLSSRNVEDHRDLLERSLAQGLCLDMVERFKRYKSHWQMPGTPAQPPAGAAGPPLDEMFCPLELRPGKATLFDRVYLEHMAALGMSPRPRVERTPVPGRWGLFRLVVSISWKDHRGKPREVRYARHCYAP